jgi:hypothetical protein
MKPDPNMQLSLLAVGISGIALVCSLFALFPGLKGLLSVVRDGVLWLAMLIILSGAGFVVLRRWQQSPTVSQRPVLEDLQQRASEFRPMLPEPRRP